MMMAHEPFAIGRVRAVLRGRVQPLARSKSAIDKQSVDGSVHVHALGLAGDGQADRRVHGGPDKALHCYPWAHYPAWRMALPGCAVLHAPGAFGENLCIEGIDEHGVCIGDRWQIGSTLLEVCPGRQPCFKLNLRFGVPDMAARVQTSLRAGWYLRVLQPGCLMAGDAIVIVERPHTQHTIGALLALIRDRVTDPALISPVLELPLPPSWRKLFERRLQSGAVEDWSRRMDGESSHDSATTPPH
jgi:MOSC domain-containing protein YiiM